MAHEKRVAFFRLASALGAKEVRLFKGELKESRFFGTGPILNKVAKDLGLSATFSRRGKILEEHRTTYGMPTKPPYVPEELQDLVDADPDLRLMRDTRITDNMACDDVTLIFVGEIAGSANILGGFSVGAESRHSVSFHYNIKYWPKPNVRDTGGNKPPDK